MFHRAGIALLAATLLPAMAGARTVSVAAPQSAVRAVSKDQVARCRVLWNEALAGTGLETVAAARGAAVPAEFVATLSIDREGDSVVFTGLATRVRLDKWSARHEARAPFAEPETWGAALAAVADGLAAAVREAPPRETAEPPARPPVRLKRSAATAVAVPKAPVPEHAGDGAPVPAPAP